jgi:hypothetical protein
MRFCAVPREDWFDGTARILALTARGGADSCCQFESQILTVEHHEEAVEDVTSKKEGSPGCTNAAAGGQLVPFD